MSKRGPGFRAATGSPIKHYGQRILRGVGDQFQPLSMTAQVADVKTTLGSVNQMLRAGNRVHFETGNCYIEHVRAGRKTIMEERNGTFEVGVWVPKSNPVRRDVQCNYIAGNRSCESAPPERSGFQGQDH